MASKNTLDLTRGPIIKRLFSFAVPIFFTLLLQHLYNAADKAVVGQFAVNGKEALAAIGATSAVTAMVLNLKSGLATGVNVHCSKLRGAGDTVSLRKGMHTGVLLSVITGAVLALIGIAISKPVLLALDTPESILPDAVVYMRVYLAGLPAMSAYNFCSGIFRSHGDTKRPMFILLISGLVNVALNLVFVIVFKMRVAGVAIATTISQLLSAICLLKILFDPKDAYQLKRKELRLDKTAVKEIFRLGIPAGLNLMAVNFASTIVQTAVNSFNDTAIIAARTVVADVMNIFIQALHAFSLGCVSFAGQCYGAKKYKRIDKLAITTILCGSGLILLEALVVTIFPEAVIGIFNKDPAVLRVGKAILLINVWGYLLNAVNDVLINCVKGMGRSIGPTVINLTTKLLPQVIWVWVFFPMRRTIEWLYLASPISWLISSVVLAIYYICIRKKLDRELALEAAQ
ncbi:MAG: MATE family efflux transporter [Oscillospiraceae bacterium]|nr:MATE family efflux transporter [Oscillospiraceae bacterium]